MNKNITDISFSRNNTNEEFVRAIISLRSFRLTNSISALYQIWNRRETSVCYRNWHNLPEHILLAQDNQNTIDYLYDAAGTKLRKVTSSDRAAGLTTDYSGPFVYEDSKLAFIQTSEGRVVPDHDAYAYEYFLRVEAKRKSRNLGNHLGNTRVVFNEQGEVLQSNSYYPFGGIMEGLNYTAGLVPENKYLYNGKEFQDDFGLDWHDYGARFYDAQLGRWHVVDNKAEKYFHESPFAYAGNNPILFIDPNGEEKYKLQGHLKVNSGFIGIGIKALGIKYSIQGAKEYEVSINISFDSDSKEFTIGGAALQREKGGDELTAGGVVGGGETTEKETGGEVKFGFNFKKGDFVTEADKIEDEDFKEVGEGSVGIFTGTEKEGVGYKAALGINPEVNAFYGAGIGINLSVQESTDEKEKEKK